MSAAASSACLLLCVRSGVRALVKSEGARTEATGPSGSQWALRPTDPFQRACSRQRSRQQAAATAVAWGAPLAPHATGLPVLAIRAEAHRAAASCYTQGRQRHQQARAGRSRRRRPQLDQYACSHQGSCWAVITWPPPPAMPPPVANLLGQPATGCCTRQGAHLAHPGPLPASLFGCRTKHVVRCMHAAA